MITREQIKCVLPIVVAHLLMQLRHPPMILETPALRLKAAKMWHLSCPVVHAAFPSSCASKCVVVCDLAFLEGGGNETTLGKSWKAESEAEGAHLNEC